MVLILYVRRGLALVLVVDFTYTLVRLKYFQYPINIKLDCYKWCDVESIVLTTYTQGYTYYLGRMWGGKAHSYELLKMGLETNCGKYVIN